MDLIATLRRSGGFEALARQLDETPARTAAGAEALLPHLLAGMRGHVTHLGGERPGVERLLAMIEDIGDGSLAEQVMDRKVADPELGVDLVRLMFGSDQAPVLVPRSAATKTSIDVATLERILPLLTMLVCGYLSALALGTANGTDAVVDLLG